MEKSCDPLMGWWHELEGPIAHKFNCMTLTFDPSPVLRSLRWQTQTRSTRHSRHKMASSSCLGNGSTCDVRQSWGAGRMVWMTLGCLSFDLDPQTLLLVLGWFRSVCLIKYLSNNLMLGYISTNIPSFLTTVNSHLCKLFLPNDQE